MRIYTQLTRGKRYQNHNTGPISEQKEIAENKTSSMQESVSGIWNPERQ